jgi:hypothetical protein
MQKLARYWATEYDWRKVEARLNALPNFITEIDSGTTIAHRAGEMWVFCVGTPAFIYF